MSDFYDFDYSEIKDKGDLEKHLDIPLFQLSPSPLNYVQNLIKNNTFAKKTYFDDSALPISMLVFLDSARKSNFEAILIANKNNRIGDLGLISVAHYFNKNTRQKNIFEKENYCKGFFKDLSGWCNSSYTHFNFSLLLSHEKKQDISLEFEFNASDFLESFDDFIENIYQRTNYDLPFFKKNPDIKEYCEDCLSNLYYRYSKATKSLDDEIRFYKKDNFNLLDYLRYFYEENITQKISENQNIKI